MSTRIANSDHNPNSRVEKMKQDRLRISEHLNHKIKYKIWETYEYEQINPNVLGELISEIEKVYWKAYKLGRKHGNDIAIEESIDNLLNQEFDMTKILLELDNSHIPQRTEVNPNSWYLKFRRFYCKRKEVIKPMLFAVPITAVLLILLMVK